MSGEIGKREVLKQKVKDKFDLYPKSMTLDELWPG